jgi:hypothetical protein
MFQGCRHGDPDEALTRLISFQSRLLQSSTPLFDDLVSLAWYIVLRGRGQAAFDNPEQRILPSLPYRKFGNEFRFVATLEWAVGMRVIHKSRSVLFESQNA